MWKPSIYYWEVGFRVTLSSSHSSAAFQPWGQLYMALLASSCIKQCQHYYTLEDLLPLGILGLNTFNHPWAFQVSYVFPPHALVPTSVHISDRTCCSQFRLLVLLEPCWMLVPWLPTVLNILGRHSSSVSYYKKNLSWMFW